MKIIQITDIHLTTPSQTILGHDPNINFTRALEHIEENHADAEAVVITGDLSDWGDKPDYERLRSHIENFCVPIHLVIGNHDDRPNFLAVFPGTADKNGFVQKSFPILDGHGIIIDTWGPASHAGHFCSQRANWLDRQLSEFDDPVYLFMHHNPVPTHLKPADQIMLLDVRHLEGAIVPHREKIRHIFFGHCHRPIAGSFHGIPVSSIRGTNHAAWSDFNEEKMLLAADLPQSYGVIVVEGPSVTVHMVEFGYEGAVHVQGLPDYATWDREEMMR
jgi:Icc protein